MAAINRKAGRENIKNSGYRRLFAVYFHIDDRHGPLAHFGRGIIYEFGKFDFQPFLFFNLVHAQGRINILAVIAVPHFKIPGALLAIAGAYRTHGRRAALALLVIKQDFPFRIVAAKTYIRGPQKASWQQNAVLLLQHEHEGQIRIMADIIVKIGHTALDEKFTQNNMGHGHGQCPVRACLYRQPCIRKFCKIGIIRRNRGNFCALVARFNIKMGIGRPGLRQIAAPGNDIAGIVPVRAFANVRLLAPNLRRGRRKIAVPVIKADHARADKRKKPGTGCEADHGHGRQRRKAENAVRSMLPDGVNQGRADHFYRLVPRKAHKTAMPAGLLVSGPFLRIIDYGFPGFHRIAIFLQRSLPQFEQFSAYIGITHPQGTIYIPGRGSAARAAPWLIIGKIGVDCGIIRVLGFPDYDAVLDVDIPAAGACAVHAMG